MMVEVFVPVLRVKGGRQRVGEISSSGWTGTTGVESLGNFRRVRGLDRVKWKFEGLQGGWREYRNGCTEEEVSNEEEV